MNETPTASVQPPYMLYRLETTPGVMNSPQVPAVHLNRVDLDGGNIETDVLTPEQAEELAAGLIAAARKARGEQS